MPKKYIKKKTFVKKVYKKKTMSLESAVRRASKAGLITAKKSITFGNDAPNWLAGTPSAGSVNTTSAVVQLITPTSSAGSIVYYPAVYQFTVQNLPDFSYYLDLYDKYRIKKVTIKMSPYNTMSASDSVGAGYGGVNGFLHYVLDYDNVAMPADTEAGIDQLMGYQTYRRRRIVGSKPIVISIRPKFTLVAEVAGGLTANNSQAPRNTWVDNTSNTLVYSGIRMIFEVLTPLATASYVTLRCETTYEVEFGSPR